MSKVLLDFLGYSFYFYANENGDPIHVHVSKGRPTERNTKFWIKRDSVVLQSNNANIPEKDLKRIYEYICTNRNMIIARWTEFFNM